jgi:hypothetical protein
VAAVWLCDDEVIMGAIGEFATLTIVCVGLSLLIGLIKRNQALSMLGRLLLLLLLLPFVLAAANFVAVRVIVPVLESLTQSLILVMSIGSLFYLLATAILAFVARIGSNESEILQRRIRYDD